MAVLFITKNKTIFKNEDTTLQQVDGLTYTNEPIGELINRDTDEDGVLDWEEGLWGTDPTQKDTDGDGELDSQEITWLKGQTVAGNGQTTSPAGIKLTATDKFSQELLSTIAALSQGGSFDEETLSKIGASLAENIGKSTPSKIYNIKDVKISTNESKEAIQVYNSKLQVLFKKYPLNVDIGAIIQESLTEDGEINTSVFKKFDPAINQLRGITKEILKTETPASFSSLEVELINGFEILAENLSDIKLMDTDVIIAFGAINQYFDNMTKTQEILIELFYNINQRLKD